MIYLDYAATHPMTPAALAAYAHAAAAAGNAASVHRAGQQARELLEEGRALVARALGVHPLTLIATSGGTEADNMALLGAAQRPEQRRRHVITAATEHSAVLAPARALAARGLDVTVLTPEAGSGGAVTPGQLAAALRPDTALVSLAYANNETGAVQDVAALAEVAHVGGALLHTDAVQAPGVLPLTLDAWGVDLASVSAHKWGGPPGTGFLYLRRGLDWPAGQLGGGQERGLRAGTHNVPGVYAAGVALAQAEAERETTHAHLRHLNDRLTGLLRGVPGLRPNHTPAGSPKVASFTAQGRDGETLLMTLDLLGVAASLGSACSAGTMQPSHVLLALGLSEADARSTLRLSFGAATTEAEIDEAARVIRQAVGGE